MKYPREISLGGICLVIYISACYSCGMIPVQDFLHAQQAAVSLALEKNITYEEAVRIIAAQKEIENKKRIELETQMINDMGNTIVSAYDEIKNVAPDVKRILNDIIE